MIMAVKSPLVPSPNVLIHRFSAYANSPATPSPHKISRASFMPAENIDKLLASEVAAYANRIFVPSPIAPSSVGTETTDIDDSTSDTQESQSTESTKLTTTSSEESVETVKTIVAPSRQIDLKIKTLKNALTPFASRLDEDEPPKSVIHAPPGFGQFKSYKLPPTRERSSSSPSQKSDATITSSAATRIGNTETSRSLVWPISPPPITTAIHIPKDWSDRATPRAQTRQEIEALENGTNRSIISAAPEDIPGRCDARPFREQGKYLEVNNPIRSSGLPFQSRSDELNALGMALSQCWTLCNTLAELSHFHCGQTTSPNTEDGAWKRCWKLCQILYTTDSAQHVSPVGPTLDLTRDFCLLLFEKRPRSPNNNLSDSVLRVSFELNNHLFNMYDRSLPDAFCERTLDFYITLCHRLMKQQPFRQQDSDSDSNSLLWASWTLAELLFSLRQANRDGKMPDVDLLGSTVQACWAMCNLFRESWTHIRPDRSTPRARQAPFAQAIHQVQRAGTIAVSNGSSSTASGDTNEEPHKLNPETPTTIFEDTNMVSPDEAPAPNIVVLGRENTMVQASTDGSVATSTQWSSAASSTSTATDSFTTTRPQIQSRPRSQSQWSRRSNSTVTSFQTSPHIASLTLFLTLPAIRLGYSRSLASTLSLHSFVKALSTDAFGSRPGQTALLNNYKESVLGDPGLKTLGPKKRVRQRDLIDAVDWLVARRSDFAWLKELCSWCFSEGETPGGWIEI